MRGGESFRRVETCESSRAREQRRDRNGLKKRSALQDRLLMKSHSCNSATQNRVSDLYPSNYGSR
jgi:hypothetical protein